MDNATYSFGFTPYSFLLTPYYFYSLLLPPYSSFPYTFLFTPHLLTPHLLTPSYLLLTTYSFITLLLTSDSFLVHSGHNPFST